MATPRKRLNELRTLQAQQEQVGQITPQPPPQVQQPQANPRQRLEQLRSLKQQQLARQPLEGPTLPGEQVEPTAPVSQPPQPPLSPFPEKPGETLAAQQLPEVTASGILAGESGLKVAALTPVLLTTTNPEEFANILKTNFPDTIGVQFSPGGEVIVANNKTGVKAIVNKEDFSAIDVLQGLGLVAAFTPAARTAGLVTGLTTKALTGAAGAGATQVGIEAIQSQLGGELDQSEIAIATALGGVGELVIPAIQAVRQARQASVQARQLGVETAEREAAQQVVEPAKEAVETIEQVTGQRVW